MKMGSSNSPPSGPEKSDEKGLFIFLPRSWTPYAELMRLGNPVGSLNTFFPYLFGSLFAACVSNPLASPSSVIFKATLLLVTAFFEHSAGCSWNDIVDADVDRLVTRTRTRPMARGAISSKNASIFTAAQCAIWLAILSQISTQCVLWTIPLLALVGLYPFTKRVTNYPQTVLGITLAWGILIGSVAFDVNPLPQNEPDYMGVLTPITSIFGCYVIWTMMIDMIYAHQDLQDDMKAGIFSMAVRYKKYPKFVLSGLGAFQVGLLAASTYLIDSKVEGLVATCFSCTLLNIWMIWSVDLKDSPQCWWWFQNGSLMMGGVISAGLSGEYLSRLTGSEG